MLRVFKIYFARAQTFAVPRYRGFESECYNKVETLGNVYEVTARRRALGRLQLPLK